MCSFYGDEHIEDDAESVLFHSVETVILVMLDFVFIFSELLHAAFHMRKMFGSEIQCIKYSTNEN